MDDLRDHALKYAEKGFRVFPVDPDGTRPIGDLVPHGCKDATADPQTIRDWWNPIPSANIGLATGKWEGQGELFAVDLDVDDEKNGIATWTEKTEHKHVPETTAVMTPSGGVHLYFRAPSGVRIKNSVSGLDEGIDVRGHGGYVVAPPSSRPDGQYRFREDTEGIAEAPYWLVSLVERKEREPVTSNGTVEAPDRIPEGERNDTIFRIGCSLRERPGMSENELRPTLYQINDARCSPPLDRSEINKITDSIVDRYERGDRIPQVRDDGHGGTSPVPPHMSNGQAETDKVEEPPSLEDLKIQTAPELMKEELDPLRPLVTYEDRTVLPEGTTVLAAKPKIGKTFFAMNTAVGVASGGKALGSGSVRAGRVLYLNLDGSKRGTRDRFEKMFANDRDNVPDQLHVLHGEYPVVGEGALELLDEWLRRRKDTELVIVDTLQHLRPTTDGRRNVYDEDYEFLYPIAKVGREHETSILLVHHLNKLERGDDLDKVSGSTALTGAVENVLILDRERGRKKADLKVRPREAPEDEFGLEFNPHVCTWTLGEIPTPGTPEREEVWNVLKSADGALELQEIADKVGKEKSAVSNLLVSLYKDDGMPIEKPASGVYRTG